MPLSSRRAHSTLGAAWIAQLLVLTLFGGAAPQPHAEVTTVSVESPNKVLQVSLDVDGGTPYYRVQRLGEAVVQRSRLGFELRDGRLDRGMVVLAQTRQSHDDTWEQPWGETRLVRDHYNELRVSLGERDGAQRTFEVIFRVYDDGLGLRYHFPKQAGMREAIIDEEATEFAIAQPADAWWIPAGEPIHYEYLYRHTPLNQVALAHTPLTLRTDSGLHIALHEAALVDYAGMWLRRTDNQRLRAQLSPAAEGWKVRRSLPFDTPWRTLQIADQATGLVESNLILNLNEPNLLGDVSWIKPSKYVGVWWSMHLNQQTWATGPKHGATARDDKTLYRLRRRTRLSRRAGRRLESRLGRGMVRQWR